jgi:hypothetical protein
MTRLNSAPNVKSMVRFHWDLAINFTSVAILGFCLPTCFDRSRQLSLTVKES